MTPLAVKQGKDEEMGMRKEWAEGTTEKEGGGRSGKR